MCFKQNVYIMDTYDTFIDFSNMFTSALHSTGVLLWLPCGGGDHVQQALQRSGSRFLLHEKKVGWVFFFFFLAQLFLFVCVKIQPLVAEYVKCLVAVASLWACSEERGRSGWNRSLLRWVQYLQAQDWQRKQNPGMTFSYKQLQRIRLH